MPVQWPPLPLGEQGSGGMETKGTQECKSEGFGRVQVLFHLHKKCRLRCAQSCWRRARKRTKEETGLKHALMCRRHESPRAAHAGPQGAWAVLHALGHSLPLLFLFRALQSQQKGRKRQTKALTTRGNDPKPDTPIRQHSLWRSKGRPRDSIGV